MKITCNQKRLNTALAAVRRTVPSRSVLPATQNVILEARENRLRLTTTNLTTTVTAWIGLEEMREEGTVSLPAKLFSDLVSGMDHLLVDIESSGDTPRVRIHAGGVTSAIVGSDPEEFPAAPETRSVADTVIEAQRFCQAVGRVAIAAAVEENRPVLTGVMLRLKDDRFTMAAADGFRLAVQEDRILESVDREFQAVIPAQSLREAHRLMTGVEDDVSVALLSKAYENGNGNGEDEEISQVMLRIVNGGVVEAELRSQLIQGRFPPYEELIPKEHTTRARMNTRDLMRASRSASMFSSQDSGSVRIQFDPEGASGEGAPTMTVSGSSQDVGDYADVMELTEMEGGQERISFNPKYLNELLHSMENKTIDIRISGPTSPGVFRTPEDGNFVHVVMPMFME